MRVLGKKVELNPVLENIKIIWVTVEHPNKGIKNPSLWFDYEGKLYYAIFEYNMHMFETFNDWDDFNEYSTKLNELKKLFSINHYIIEVDYTAILEGYLGEYCEFEIDFIKKYKQKSLTI